MLINHAINNCDLSKDLRMRKITESTSLLHFALRATRRTTRAFSCVAKHHLTGRASLAKIYSHAAMRSGSYSGYRAEQNDEHTGRIYHAVYHSLCVVHGRHRKSVWEVVQAFGRAVSAKSYNFDGATALLESSPVASGLQHHPSKFRPPTRNSRRSV